MKMQRKFTKPEWISLKWVKENLDVATMMAIATLVAILVFVSWFSSVDWRKATDDDWNYLYEKAYAIQEQQLETIVNDENVNVEIRLESEECILILKKGEDNKFSEIIKSDKAVPTFKAIVALPFMIVMAVLMGFVILFLEIVAVSIFMGLFEKKLKQKRET